MGIRLYNFFGGSLFMSPIHLSGHIGAKADACSNQNSKEPYFNLRVFITLNETLAWHSLYLRSDASPTLPVPIPILIAYSSLRVRSLSSPLTLIYWSRHSRRRSFSPIVVICE